MRAIPPRPFDGAVDPRSPRARGVRREYDRLTAQRLTDEVAREHLAHKFNLTPANVRRILAATEQTV